MTTNISKIGLALSLGLLSISSYATGFHKTAYSQKMYDQLQVQEQQIESEIQQLQQHQNTAATTNHIASFNDGLFMIAISADRYALKLLQIKDQTPLQFGAGIELDAQQTLGNTMPQGSNNETGTVAQAYENGNQLMHFEVLSTYARLNDWTHVAIEVEDAGGTAAFRNALINFGNLSKSPWYLSIGRTRADFAYFEGNGPYSNTLFNQIYRADFNNPQINLGYYNGPISNTFTVFQPQAYHGQHHDPQFSDLLVLRHKFSGALSGMLNMGYINDMRGTGSGFDLSTQTYNQPTSRTGAFTVGTSWNYKQVSAFGIFNTTLKDQPITNNNKMYGYTLGASALPVVYGKNTNFTVTFTHMLNAQHISSVIPARGNATTLTGIEDNIEAFYSVPLRSNIIATLQYNWDHTYNNRDVNTITLDFMAFI